MKIIDDLNIFLYKKGYNKFSFYRIYQRDNGYDITRYTFCWNHKSETIDVENYTSTNDEVQEIISKGKIIQIAYSVYFSRACINVVNVIETYLQSIKEAEDFLLCIHEMHLIDVPSVDLTLMRFSAVDSETADADTLNVHFGKRKFSIKMETDYGCERDEIPDPPYYIQINSIDISKQHKYYQRVITPEIYQSINMAIEKIVQMWIKFCYIIIKINEDSINLNTEKPSF